MRFSRLQVILMFLCFIAFGASLGFLATGTPTVMPVFLLVFLVIFLITFVPKKGRILSDAATYIRNGIQTAKPHPQNTGSALHRNVRALGQNMLAGVRQITPLVQSWVIQQLDVANANSKAFIDRKWDTMQQKPNFWCGVGCMVIATGFFLHTYFHGSFGKSFHAGLFLTFSAAIFFINHNGWEKASDFVTKNYKGVWLATSVACLALAYEHNWSLLWPGISTALATIVFFGWVKPIKKATGEWLGKLWSHFVNLTSGEYGWGPAFITYAIILFAIIAGMSTTQGKLDGKMLEFMQWSSVFFVLFLCVGVVLLGEKLFKEKKD